MLAARFACGVDPAGFGRYDPCEGLTWKESWMSVNTHAIDPRPALSFNDLAATLRPATACANAIPANATEPLIVARGAAEFQNRAIYQSEARSCEFLWRLHQAASMKISKLLTDNGSQSTDRFTGKTKKVSGRHAFDKRCAGFQIEHRLAPLRHPQTSLPSLAEMAIRRIGSVKPAAYRSAGFRHVLNRISPL